MVIEITTTAVGESGIETVLHSYKATNFFIWDGTNRDYPEWFIEGLEEVWNYIGAIRKNPQDNSFTFIDQHSHNQRLHVGSAIILLDGKTKSGHNRLRLEDAKAA